MGRIDPGRVAAAYLDQWSLMREWCDGVDDWSLPSAVAGWSLRELMAHFGLVANTIVRAADQPTDDKPMRLGDYIAGYADVADGIDERTHQAARSDTFVFDADAIADQAATALHAVRGDPVVIASRGPIRWSDFLRTRCIELSLHTDDIVRSLRPNAPAPQMSLPCLQVATRALADVLGWRAPGRSVEVRVPPFAAVQCIEGPRHTRGTPAAVVEMDALTFCRLAAGRVSWQEAVATGGVQASGLRTDLTPYLPLF